jgi:putative peptidoglycan lipid II flippase
VLAAIGAGVVAGGVVLVVAAAVMMGIARGPLRTAVRGLRSTEGATVQGEVAGG